MKNEENDLVILLTGTITPNSLFNLTIKDPVLRRKQYLEAIHYYLNKTNRKIVFTENSGDFLEDFPHLPDRIEYLTFSSAPIYPDRGIGYKEMEIIDFAMQNSNFLKNTKRIVKVTGRLKILNLERISRNFLKQFNNKSSIVYANTYRPENLDSKCFFFTKDFWAHLKEEGRFIDQQYNFESALWVATYKYQTLDERFYIPQNIPLRINGMSGSFGVKYKHNLLFHYGRYIRNFLRTLMGKSLMKK